MVMKRVEPDKEGHFFVINLNEKGIAQCKLLTRNAKINDN